MEQKHGTLSTIIVMACTAASRLFGYVKMALITAFFGATGSADVINAIFLVPNSLRKLFAEGAFSAAFIPVLSSTLADDPSGDRARRLVRSLSAFLIAALTPLVVLSLAAPDLLLRLLLDFPDPAKVPLARSLLRWEFNYILPVSLGALAMAVLNSHGRFTVSALSPLVFSLGVILCLVFLRAPLGPVSMGVGVLAGGLLQLAVQLPSLRRLGYGLAPAFRFSDPAFRKTLALWLPFVASASVFTLNQFVAQRFASGLEDGSVSALQNAITVMNLPIGIFTASVMTVLFPKLSAQAARSDTGGLRATVAYGFEFLLALLVPASAALALFGREIIAIAFQRGKFTPADTLMTHPVLVGYAAGLAALSLYQFLQRLFYSLKDFRTPLASAMLVAVVDIGLSLWLKETTLRAAGLAVANSVAFTAGFIFLAIIARRRIGAYGAARILTGAGKAVAASLPLAGLLAASRMLWPDLWRAGGTLVNAGRIVGILALAALATLAMFALLRMPFATELLRFRRKP
ncbi:MAG: murein biosynthesis integral membrane protein MurJ [Spirochaetes bacterium]|nr:murein biosynthesis integral membrane protein MurJ [Spirochaetota bacterium]